MCLQLKCFKVEQEKDETNKDFMPSFLMPDRDDAYYFNSHNGLVFLDAYLPEEILTYILSFVDAKQLLTYSLVCRQWNRIIKSRSLWSIIYERSYKRKARDLPWYLYYCLFATNYFTNMLDMESDLREHCKFIIDSIDDLPIRTDSVQQDIIDYHRSIGDSCSLVIKTRLKPQMRRTFCFRPEKCYTEQWAFKLRTNKLIQHILDTYKPHLYFKGCGALYGIHCGFTTNDDYNGIIAEEFLERKIVRKNLLPKQVYSISLTITDYPNKIIDGVIIENKYLEIAAGGTLDGSEIRLLFDSISQSESITTPPNISFTYTS